MRVLLARDARHQPRAEEQRDRLEQRQLQWRQEIALLTQPTTAIFRYGDAKLILNRTNVSIRGADFDVDPPRDLLRGDAVRTMLIEQGPHARQSRRAISLCESLALGISHVHHDHPLVRSRDRVVGRSERNMTV